MYCLTINIQIWLLMNYLQGGLSTKLDKRIDVMKWSDTTNRTLLSPSRAWAGMLILQNTKLNSRLSSKFIYLHLLLLYRWTNEFTGRNHISVDEDLWYWTSDQKLTWHKPNASAPLPYHIILDFSSRWLNTYFGCLWTSHIPSHYYINHYKLHV